MMICGLCGRDWQGGHRCQRVEPETLPQRQARHWEEAQLGADHWRKASVQEYGRKQALNAGAGD